LLRVYPASQSLASSRDLLGVNASVSYTLPVGDGLIRAVGANRVELERNGRHDADAALRLRVAAPRTEYLRVVVDGIVRSRYRNYLNRDFQIGGDSRLRGYPHAGFSEARKGPSVAAVNAELRSRSVGILGSEVGAVAFYDAADAGPRLTDLRLRQSAGLGARIALPFLSRAVARADLAVPIGRGHPALPFRLDVYFSLNDQAFPMPALEAPTVMEPKL
jgi:hypothetical protein